MVWGAYEEKLSSLKNETVGKEEVKGRFHGAGVKEAGRVSCEVISGSIKTLLTSNLHLPLPTTLSSRPSRGGLCKSPFTTFSSTHPP